MNSVMEDKITPRKLTKYHLTMAFLAFTVLAVALTTIFGASSSGARKPVKTKTSFQLAADNTSTNPVIKLDCEQPRLTLAVMIDRSGSVSGVASNPVKYKESVNKFVEDLSKILISRGGDLDVLLWGYGSRSIVQNDKTASNQLITKVDSSTSLDAMKAAVNAIFFSTGAVGGNDLSMNGNTTPYAVARGYNGFPTTGTYTLTNWDDALLPVKNLGSSSDFSDPAPGKHINLALMLTDGSPNVNNGANRTFEVGDLTGYNSADGREYAAQTVTELRAGNGLPKMAVRGILINSTADAAMNEVFGPSNWSKADNFEADLARVLDDIIDSIDSNVECQYVYVTPKIELSVPSNVTLVEGSTAGTRVNGIVVRNVSTMTDRKGNVLPCDNRCNLQNATLTYNGVPLISGAFSLPYSSVGVSKFFDYALQLGAVVPNDKIDVEVEAVFTPDTMIRLDPNYSVDSSGNYTPEKSKPIAVGYTRLPLPA